MNNKSLQTEEFQKLLGLSLLSSNNSEEFIKEAFSHYKNLNPTVSLEGFARKGHFSSKTQVHYLITGKRKLTLNTLECLIKVFKLKSKHVKILKLYIDTELKFDEKKSLEISRLKERLRQDLNKKTEKTFCNNALIKVFLSLKKNPLSFLEISQKTKLSDIKINKALAQLLENEYIQTDELKQKYILLKDHLELREYGKDEAFKKLFLSTLNNAKSMAEKNFNADESLFFNSFITVKKSNIPSLAKKLQEVLMDFSDEHIDNDADNIVTLSTAFY